MCNLEYGLQSNWPILGPQNWPNTIYWTLSPSILRLRNCTKIVRKHIRDFPELYQNVSICAILELYRIVKRIFATLKLYQNVKEHLRDIGTVLKYPRISLQVKWVNPTLSICMRKTKYSLVDTAVNIMNTASSTNKQSTFCGISQHTWPLANPYMEGRGSHTVLNNSKTLIFHWF